MESCNCIPKVFYLCKSGNTLFQRAKSSGSAELWKKYKGMHNKVTSILRNLKQSFSRNINTGNKNCFWKIMSLMLYTCADNELDKVNMLNNYYNNSKCFTTSLPPLNGSFESAEHLELPEGGPENLFVYRGGGYMSSTINRCFLKASGPD